LTLRLAASALLKNLTHNGDLRMQISLDLCKSCSDFGALRP